MDSMDKNEAAGAGVQPTHHPGPIKTQLNPAHDQVLMTDPLALVKKKGVLLKSRSANRNKQNSDDPIETDPHHVNRRDVTVTRRNTLVKVEVEVEMGVQEGGGSFREISSIVSDAKQIQSNPVQS